MITHIVFDFDGTLADSPMQVVALYNEVAGRLGFGQLTPDNLPALRGLGVRERARLLGVPLYRLPVVMAQVLRQYRQITPHVTVYPGVPALLRSLHDSGYRVMIVSTNTEDNIRDVLRRHGLESEVDGILCSSRIFGKARLLRQLLRREGIRASQALYVGDETRDIDACREVGVSVIAATWGIDTVARLRAAGPDALADAPEDVPQLVTSAAPRPGHAPVPPVAGRIL